MDTDTARIVESVKNVAKQVNAGVDIVAVIGSYLDLKRSGESFKCICPFHFEKTPSFLVNPFRQQFHCFGCGAEGDAVDFIARHEELEFAEALELLVKKYGIEIEKDAAGWPSSVPCKSRSMENAKTEDEAFLSKVRELKEQADIALVIKSYIDLQPYGDDASWEGQCPWGECTETLPKPFHVNSESRTYYCFDCGDMGDVVDFVMRYEKVDQRKALNIVTEKCDLDFQFD